MFFWVEKSVGKNECIILCIFIGRCKSIMYPFNDLIEIDHNTNIIIKFIA